MNRSSSCHVRLLDPFAVTCVCLYSQKCATLAILFPRGKNFSALKILARNFATKK